MSRFDDEIKPVIIQQAAVLGGTLTDAMAVALGQAREDGKRYPYERFPHMLPMLLRCALRLELEKKSLPAGWELGGDSRLMGQLLLTYPDMALDLRLLKERRRTYSGGVPAAGHSIARRRAWSSDVPLPLEEFEESEVVERTTVLWVWDFLGRATDKDAGFTQRLVHTIGPGTYGRAVPLNLSLDLLPGGEIFDRQAFKGGEDDTDFFNDDTVELDETGEDEV